MPSVLGAASGRTQDLWHSFSQYGRQITHMYHPTTGFLIEAGPRVPAPVYFEQSARLLKVRNLKQQENKTLSTLTKY